MTAVSTGTTVENGYPVATNWVQMGVDYVLIGIATGVIANIILNQ